MGGEAEHAFRIRCIFVFLLLLCVPLFSGCGNSIQVETVFITPQITETETPVPAPTPSPTPTGKPTVSTPPQFLSQETLPPKKEQLINPKKATYERMGFEKAEKIRMEETAKEGKNLPIIYVTTKNAEYILSRTEYTSCVIDVYNCPEKYILDEASAAMRVRGNSSGYYGDVEKIKANPVPYRVRFDKKTNLLGLNDGAKFKNWVLLKAGYDVMRNEFALRLGRAIMGDHAFCSDSTLVHLYVNDVYQGVYTLCEQCQVNENRVDITEPSKGYNGIDIGYYMVIDNNPEDVMSFQMDYGKHRVTDIEGDSRTFAPTAYTIKSDVNTMGQIQFISKYMNNVFEIVYQACEKNRFLTFDANYDLVYHDFASAQETVEAVLDIESIVNMYLLYEVMHDYDVGEGSFYMCVDLSKDSRAPKLQFTSPWDFNWTCEGRTDRYWAGAFSELSFIGANGDRTNPWFVVLIKQDWFHRLVSEKWTELAKTNAVAGALDEEIEILENNRIELNAWRRNSADAAYNVIVWLKARLKWMDAQFLLPDAHL